MNKQQRLAARCIAARLQEIRNIATMKTASIHYGDSPSSFGADITDLVRESTRIWRESWIIGPLDEIIKELQNVKATIPAQPRYINANMRPTK